MTMLADAKVALRITSTDYDDEIEDLIDAVQTDLILSGVSAAAVADMDSLEALVKRAALLYIKAEFGLDNPDSEKYMTSYLSLVSHLALSSEYAQPKLTGLTGDMTKGDETLTTSDYELLAVDDWISVAGAGGGGAILIAQVESIDDSDGTAELSRVAGTTVSSAVVKIL